AEIMRDIAPDVTRVAILTGAFQMTSVQSARRREAETAAASLGLQPTLVLARAPQDLEDAITTLASEPHGGPLVSFDSFIIFHRKLIIELAARSRLPAAYSHPIFVQDGGLMSYGAEVFEQYRGGAGYVDRILKGPKLVDLPVQLPIKSRLVV